MRVGSPLRVSLLISCSAVAFAVIAPAAQANIVLSATATSSIGGLTSSPVSPPHDILPIASDGAGNSTFGHVYAYDSGTIGSRSSGENTYHIDGTARYTNTYTVGQTGNYVFNYTLSPGEVSAFLSPGANGSQKSSVSAVITAQVDSGPVVTKLDYHASMDLQTPGSSPIFQETGASGLNLNPGGLSTGINFGTYAWDSYASSISLGTLLAGQSVIIDYVIGSSADGTTTPGFSPGCGYGYGYGGECYGGPIFTAFNNVCAGESLIFDGCGSGFYALGSAIGRFGDPLNFGDTASIALVPVPEPASIGVLGAGVAGLAFMRRRRSKA